MVTSRYLLLYFVFTILSAILIYRIFYLQIIKGESYLNNFQLKIQKERVIEGTRGNIYDRNGTLLAYNELAYSVTIEDVYESGKTKNERLNHTLIQVIRMIEKHGDKVISDFDIILNEHGEYEFNLEGTKQKRFLADIYGRTKVENLRYAEETATPDEVITYLCKKYKIGQNIENPETKENEFVPGYGYSKKEILELVTIRYQMGLYSFQKYITTTIATDVSDETVAVIMENIGDLDGIAIEETTIRKYNFPYYFSHILGYTGKIDQDELDELSKMNDSYTMNDTVGKGGIEQVMELELQGIKGSETIFVDNLGRVIDTTNVVDSQAGNDLYLSIDKDLQVAVYNILEQNIAGIVVSKMKNIYNYDPSTASKQSNIAIPIDNVYFSLINNNVIDISRFSAENASETEKAVYDIFLMKQKEVLDTLRAELHDKMTPYDKLSKEYQAYETYVVSMLTAKGVLVSSSIDKEDETYLAWTTEKTISLQEYLSYAISKNWIDITKLQMESQYSDSIEVLQAMLTYIIDGLENNIEFSKKMYKYMISNQVITGKQICMILWEQDLISVDEKKIDALKTGKISAYDFMVEMVSTLQITPAQLALDPCSGSCVVTDVNTGEVLALVSYPGYDINKLANGVDAEYYAKIQADLSVPQWSAATQQRTAPGSTFKIVSSVAAIEEGVVSSLGETITCTGTYEKLYPTIHHCWVYPGAHGAMNVSSAIANSCNNFFYEVGFRLSQDGTGYNSDYGLQRLRKYADLFGLTEKSGIEIQESEPKFSDELAVPSAIGQGTHNYTTVGLARYVTTIANSGRCFNLSILDKLTNSKGELIEDYTPEVRNQIEISDSLWNAVHSGMRKVVETKPYFNELAVNVAGKTGTAQQDRTRSNHALFISYAPYENPEISVTVRIAFGYESAYAAQTAKDVYSYYYGLAEEDDLLTGTANIPDEVTGGGD